jgi:hypothetical protein
VVAHQVPPSYHLEEVACQVDLEEEVASLAASVVDSSACPAAAVAAVVAAVAA